MAHGHPPSLGVPSRRDGAKAQGKSPSVRSIRGRWRQGDPQPEIFRSRRYPDEVRVGKITRLQSALAVLGEDDEIERSTLEVAIKKAQAQAVVPLVSEQIEDTQKFIERANKRVVLVDEYVQWAQEWKVECDKEFAGGRRTSCKIARAPGSASNGGATSTASACTGASSTSPARLCASVSGFHSETPSETRRFRVFLH